MDDWISQNKRDTLFPCGQFTPLKQSSQFLVQMKGFLFYMSNCSDNLHSKFFLKKKLLKFLGHLISATLVIDCMVIIILSY